LALWVTGGIITDAEGQLELRAALVALKEVHACDRVVFSNAVQVWFHRHHAALGFGGASSHSGRRIFDAPLPAAAVAGGEW